MNRTPNLLLPVLLLVGLSACDRPAAPDSVSIEVPGAAHENDATHDIDWFKGNVDQAFGTAKVENRPLFLYWGAIWCPPCQEIKNTVFKSSEFITLTDLFVPVYLDGDTAQAQAQGEKFGVKGYPTMIVFSPAGEEITRIPGGIDISKYNSVLQLSLNRLRPTKDLLQLALDDPSSLQPADFTQLAYYSWGQDFKVLPEDAPPTLFRDLADLAAAHDKVASARLFMQYLVSSVEKDSADAPVRIGDAHTRLTDILQSDQLVLACWDSLAYWPEISGILTLPDDKRQALTQLWQGRLMALRKDESLPTAEQLGGWLPLLYFHFKDSEEPLPSELESQMEADISTANRLTTNAFARQSVVNQIYYLYQQAKMYDQAHTLLLAELDRSAAPYYFMSGLASLAEKQDKFGEAVEWYRRAYESSEGAATRFQWGAAYVRGLIRMKPDEHELILTTAESLFKELDGADEVFTGRNFRVLRSLNNKLDAWKEESTAEPLAKRFVSHIVTLCSDQPAGSMESENCHSLISGDTAS